MQNIKRAFFACIILLASTRLFAVGWTPTDAGLTVNFQPGDQFLLSVMVDDDNNPATPAKEYFVCHYSGYTGGIFKYKAGHELRLIPQAEGATVPSEASVWTIDAPLTRVKNKVDYALGGISYTMWSSFGYTLMSGTPSTTSAFKFLGCLSNDKTYSNLCDVVFVVPTVRATENMDPNGTLETSHTAEERHRGTGSQSWAFDGKMGTGFAGMTYREVYWFDIPRFNTPNAYTNASLVTVNTTLSNVKCANGDFTLTPGSSGYAFADNKHKPTPRTLFRLYVLGEKEFHGCNSYFFGWDTQDYLRYRSADNMTTFSSWRKIYTLDHFECMELVEEGKPYYQTAGMKVPDRDSVYYYVGYNNAYHSAEDLGSGSPKSASVFTPIDSLRIRALKDQPKAYVPAKNAYGYMAIDTTSSENNLGVAFEPAGYFFQTSSGVNVPMRQIDDSTWMSEQMWYIQGEYMKLEGRVVLYTGPEFSAKDPGAEISNDWSKWVKAPDIPVAGTGGSSKDKYGWPRVHTNRATPNGGIEFVEATNDTVVIYHNNGHFGADIPYQYPIKGEATVTIQDARLLGDYTFYGWAASANGEVVVFPKDSTSKTPRVGQEINLRSLPAGLTLKHGATGDTLHLYAKATYKGAINVAISFLKEDGKRYFLTHPGGAPRYARARHYSDWTNVRQGIGDAENSDPNYLTSYKILGRDGICEKCGDGEYVLAPKHETMKGGIDSLIFYEDYQPNGDEYLGLYYTDPNTIIANNTWAGLFTSTKGWPTPANPCIKDTRISSTHYLYTDKGVITRTDRSNSDKPNVKYIPATNQFDGVDGDGTDFMISGVGVVDAHYVILPDTTDATTPWTNEITFDYHTEPSMQQVWSKLIGKQLLAQMKVGNDTIYFHPNPDKTVTNANELRLSQDYRLTHTFEYIYDKRPAVAGRIAEGDSVIMEETENGFCCNIYSGASSPIGPTDDIIDTLRVWLRPASTSKVKAYYGRWKKTGPTDGLTVKSDGSRYRDILVKTKTYHYGAVQTRLALKPEQESYNFSPLAGQPQTLNFTLEKQTYRQLLDAADNIVREEVLAAKDTTTVLNLTSAACTLTGGDVIFTIGTKTATSIPLTTKEQNTDRADRDTLNISVTIDGKAISARVPLMQAALSGSELVWSVVDPATSRRFFITAGSKGLIYREFTQSSLTLYKLNDIKTKLIKGSYDPANSKIEYITPWAYTFTKDTISLKTEYGVNKYFAISGSEPGSPDVGNAASKLIFEMVRSYTNDNANYEEQVKLRYGPEPYHWLKFNGTALELVSNSEEASTFSWTYLLDEFNIQNNGTYPNHPSVEFGYNSTAPVTVQTAFKAYHEYSMLLDNKKVYVCREDESGLANLTDAEKIWKLTYEVSRIPDARGFDGTPAPTSGLSMTTDKFASTITPSGTSPMGGTVDGLHVGVTIDGKYANIVDTLQVTVGLQDGATVDYRFKGDWSSFSSLSDACLKIPLIRKTYHEARYDSLVCVPEGEEYNYTFPATLPTGEGADSTHTFYLGTFYRHGTNTIDAEGHIVKYVASASDTLTKKMHLGNPALAEIRLVDEYGKIPDWCEISAKGDSTVTMKCLKNGIRSPRSATLYFAYIVDVSKTSTPDYRYANFKLTVSQPSFFQYANNQTLVHSPGASGDPLMPDGRQQVHENKRILYYYNPGNYGKENQAVELPVRERGFYGWWRWYREGKDENDFNCSDMDILDSLWVTPPRNVGKFNYPFRIIGDSVDDGKGGKKLVTMGRYTVFHYPSVQYATKVDPPAKSPQVVPPINKDTVTYVVDLGNYYDNLPLSMAHINQIDTAVLDTMQDIIEPTLSLREVFELHPWTEMAATLDNYKSSASDDEFPLAEEDYMEDHEVMAPIGNRLLLRTEQRYIYDNLTKKGHSESLLGYYMRDDNWATPSWSTTDKDGVSRQDTMIWCGGWDADCLWYTYNPSTKTYTPCNHPITVDDDFLNVPAKTSMSGDATDTVYYCLRARSKATTVVEGKDETVDGDYWFNICRYKVMYHNPRKFGPLAESTKGGVTKALITDDEIEQNYEVLERLNFDYVKPGKDYQVYPHPLPWGDGSYGYSYPVRPDIPDNRYHNDFAPNFPGVGEYGLINKIPYSNYWHKMEQHGGAENGYMIYCDGMNSSGQVAALSLETRLCEGQKMYFSAYVGNPSNQSGKANPNFTISVQGSADGDSWDDITTYMTGDIKPSNQWSQIYFPIKQEGAYDKFRVRIYNMASDFDGNDFIIDDMCVFATKPPLIAYQANTKCVDDVKNDSIIHVVLRVDYQGFIDTLTYNGTNVYYTVQQTTKAGAISFVPMIDGYLYEGNRPGITKEDVKITPDTVFGHIPMPAHNYVPTDRDSIFINLSDFVTRFDTTFANYQKTRTGTFFNKGYLYENLDGVIRPVLYVIHNAKMTADNTYTVRLSAEDEGLMSDKCAMTSNLKVTNRMILMLDNEEKEDPKVTNLCSNATYDLSVRVKGSLFLDSIAPLDVNGSCTNDWLLYGDTSDVSSLARYGYKYSDIKKVIKDILRSETASDQNRFARSLTEVSHNNMLLTQKSGKVDINGTHEPTPGSEYDPYVILSHLVNNGFLTLYQSQITATVALNDSLQYVIFPILGTGSEDIYKNNMEVCPTPMVIKLKSSIGGGIPLIVGGIKRDSTELKLPVNVLVNERTANDEFNLYIDSIMASTALHSVTLLSTDDPDYYEGVHRLNLEPDRVYNFGGDNSGYYIKGQNIVLRPSASNNYQMRQGYHYTFGILMQGLTGSLNGADGCPIGTIPFTLGIVPDYLRWAPQSAEDNRWNNPDNWIGVDVNNDTIPNIGRFAPLPNTDVIISDVPAGMPYPRLPDDIASADSVKHVNFAYNICDDIRFLPGAAIGQQQNLTCDVTVVDMTMPYNKWALRAAPVTGMLSGDIYMANADLSGETKMWSVGTFDANGRSYKTGNATYWLSLYDKTIIQKGNGDQVSDSTREAAAGWSKLANGMTESMAPSQGWAVYARTKSGAAADIRLPKNDDVYYYYYTSGDQSDISETGLRAERDRLAGGSGKAGKLAFQPTTGSQSFTLTNGVESTSFVFGNPTMGYIDIWGFIADNSLENEIRYIDAGGSWQTVTKGTTDLETDTITNPKRYLPPMHAMVVKVASAATSTTVTLNTNHIVTHPSQKAARPGAPRRYNDQRQTTKGIMTITAINPLDPICRSRLLLGQGYSDAVVSGEDAILTTVNINNFSSATPSTPFNIYAVNDGYGLSIDLRDSIVNVPLSFSMTESLISAFDPVTYLWFTGVNAIDGQLVLYDALMDTERPIIDGTRLNIETPEVSHQRRYYIRRRGFNPDANSGDEGVTTGVGSHSTGEHESATKIMYRGNVYILRGGHVYTMFGQKVR